MGFKELLTKNIGATPTAPPTPPSIDRRAARDLDVGELRDLVQEGVFRGVMKAVAVYALISFLIWLVISLVGESNRYS